MKIRGRHDWTKVDIRHFFKRRPDARFNIKVDGTMQNLVSIELECPFAWLIIAVSNITSHP